jgi:hypothetical protein
MKEIIWFLKLWYMNNVIATGFNVYFFLQLTLQGTVSAWIYFALMCFDAATWLSEATRFNSRLCRKTRWARPSLTRQQARKNAQKRRRTRSPMTYVGNNKRRSATTHRLWRKGRRPLIPIILWCAASLNQADRVKGFLRFDTNSVPIAINTGATRSLTDNRRDLLGPLQRSNTRINGIGGHQQGQWMGTVKWSIFDDDGLRHDLLIPNTVLVAKGALPFRLLLPQHFAQENIKSGVDKHARGTINSVDNWLSWGDLTYRVTAQLTQGNILPMINTVADYNKFSAFVSRVQPPDEPQHMFAPHLIPGTCGVLGARLDLVPEIFQQSLNLGKKMFDTFSLHVKRWSPCVC